MLWFAMMLMPTGPSAMKLTALADVAGSNEGEKMSIAKFLCVGYVLDRRNRNKTEFQMRFYLKASLLMLSTDYVFHQPVDLFHGDRSFEGLQSCCRECLDSGDCDPDTSGWSGR